MTISFEPRSVIRRNSFFIVGAAIVLAIIFAINAVVSGYLLRRNTVEDRAEQNCNSIFNPRRAYIADHIFS